MDVTQKQGQTATVAAEEHLAAVASEKSPTTTPQAVAKPQTAEPLVETELLVEDVSIDGMCGVY